MTRIRIGTQGWSFDRWVGPFYPDERVDRLEMYARAFDTVEVDSTWYAIPPEERVVAWRDRTPDDFVFCLKLPGEVTHERRLRLAHDVLAAFLGVARRLDEKLGHLLIQLPPDFAPTAANREAVASFLAALPAGFDFAIEFRGADWLTDATMALLDRTGTTLCVSVGPWLATPEAIHAAGRAPGRDLYLRWLGDPRHQPDLAKLIEERDRELDAWADAIRAMEGERDVVYGFPNNDYQGHAPETARRLQARLGLPVTRPGELREQRDLFL